MTLWLPILLISADCGKAPLSQSQVEELSRELVGQWAAINPEIIFRRNPQSIYFAGYTLSVPNLLTHAIWLDGKLQEYGEGQW